MNTVTETAFKGVFALRFVTETVEAVFLPANGGKLASLTDRATGRELLAQAPGDVYLPLTREGSYVDSECSAFDDMFPTIDPVTPGSGARQGVEYPDHGEAARSAYTYTVTGDTIVMTYTSETLAYQFTKTVTDAKGALRIDYRVDNLSDEPFDCLWAGHCMLAACEGGVLTTPWGENAPCEIMFDTNAEFGSRGDVCKATAAMLQSAPFRSDGNAYKYYFTDPLPAGQDSVIRYTDPVSRRSVALRFDPENIRFLGIWINNGSFKNMYNVAPELCTAPYDTPFAAKERGHGWSVAPHGSRNFYLEITTEAK